MKQVAILTILDNINLGTILQAYATARMIERSGHRPLFINYFRPGSSVWHQVRGILRDNRRSKPKRCVHAAAALVLVPAIKRRLRSFLTRRFPFTRPYRSAGELRKRAPQADLYLTGSDQVWNTRYNRGVDPAFFLDFTDGIKASYASSVGMERLSAEEEAEMVRLLRPYRALSVRESQTAAYFHRLGFPQTTHDLDPTLLLTADEWKKAVGYRPGRYPDYLLVYSVEGPNNDFIFRQASALAREKGLKLFAVTAADPLKLRKYGCDRIFAFASPARFVSLVADASFVVASSFHGTVFSILFNKEFITIAPEHFNIRMQSLVDQFGIAHRTVTGREIRHSDLRPVDFESVNRELARCRALSEDHLRTALSLNR